MATEERAEGLTDEEFEDFNVIVKETLNALIDCADKNNIDRDSLIKYFCVIFGMMAEVSTFKNYKKGGENNG